MRKIAILGSTGSIGTQALQVIRLHPDEFQVTALTAHENAELLFAQIREFHVSCACLTGAELPQVPDDLSFCHFYERQELDLLASECDADDLLVSVVGIAGLSATLCGRRSGKRILLANKETLVAGGKLVMEACTPQNGELTLLPVDSEHSAIFQCLEAQGPNKLSKILLTASGGPFRTWSKDMIDAATKAQALKHPTWTMGQKVTIDSATMFNKALEIIEAKWLFNVLPSQIQVVVHPESIVHSMISFEDGAVIAQLGTPDMRVPILYAMSYPKRMTTGVKPLDFSEISALHFENGDPVRFPSLRIAYEALNEGGAACCMLNAANEVAVVEFVKDKLKVGDIFRIVEETLNKIGYRKLDSIEDVLEADMLARQTARSLIQA